MESGTRLSVPKNFPTYFHDYPVGEERSGYFTFCNASMIDVFVFILFVLVSCLILARPEPVIMSPKDTEICTNL